MINFKKIVIGTGVVSANEVKTVQAEQVKLDIQSLDSYVTVSNKL